MNNTAYIIGTGSYLPDYIVTNEELAGITGLSPHDIKKRTGIIERRRANKNEATSDLATQAALSALKSAGVAVEDVGLIVLSTTSPDMFMPSTACLVQKNIGAKNAAAFDVNASCSGFLYSLNIAEMFIRSGQTDTALVIAAEVKSLFVDPRDKETAILFGDGAGAIVLSNVIPAKAGIRNDANFGVDTYQIDAGCMIERPDPLAASMPEKSTLSLRERVRVAVGLNAGSSAILAEILDTWLYADGSNWK